MTNLSVGLGRDAIARAALESIPHQITDVINAMDQVTGGITELLVDGGLTRNVTLMQLMADTAGRPVRRSNTAELSALGVAQLAGIKAGLWTRADLTARIHERGLFTPNQDEARRSASRAAWRLALQRARLAPQNPASRAVGGR